MRMRKRERETDERDRTLNQSKKSACETELYILHVELSGSVCGQSGVISENDAEMTIKGWTFPIIKARQHEEVTLGNLVQGILRKHTILTKSCWRHKSREKNVM